MTGHAQPVTDEIQTLQQAIAHHQIEGLSAEQLQQIDEYCRVLWDKNQKMNLTRHVDYDTFAARDIIDSVELAAQLRSGEKVLDVGSGGGVPGIVLQILRPDLSVCLSDCVEKKSLALAEMVSHLKLQVPVFRDRAENVLSATEFDTLVARAVGPLWKILRWFENSWERFERLLLIKGPAWVEERGEARHRGYLKGLQLRNVHNYKMPGRDSESSILMIWPTGKDAPS